MKIQRDRRGTITVRLRDHERAALASLPEQLRAIVEGADPGLDAVRARLFPPASTDEEVERKYRELAGDSLVQDRLAVLGRFAGTLADARAVGGGWEASLDSDAAAAWVGTVNDARLALGMVLGITREVQWEQGPDPDDPASALLWWLGLLEEELVAALADDLPG